MMGLFSFFYGTVHTAAYIVFDRVAGLDAPIRTQPVAATAHTMSAIGADLLRPFCAIGLVALVLMAPLAATSTVGMIRRLGGIDVVVRIGEAADYVDSALVQTNPALYNASSLPQARSASDLL